MYLNSIGSGHFFEPEMLMFPYCFSCDYTLTIVQNNKERGASRTTTSRGAESTDAKEKNTGRACS